MALRVCQSAWRRRSLSFRCFSTLATTTITPPDNNNNNNNRLLIPTADDIRNLSVVAHVDHGKTSLVDQMLRAASYNNNTTTTTNDDAMEERLLDSGDLEKERGITITAKVTRLNYKNHTLNIADTPGHSDFSGEVDRFLTLSSGVLLVVDGAEGPKSQTKYVLSRALANNLTPMVVFNKCDRPDAIANIDSGETETKVQELFDLLAGHPVDYLSLYASAKTGWVTEDPLEALELTDLCPGDPVPPAYTMSHLLDAMIQHMPAPPVPEDTTTFSMAAVTVGSDTYLGRTCTGRIVSGSIAVNEPLVVVPRGETESHGTASAVSGVFVNRGIRREPLDRTAYAGDIVTLTGVPEHLAVGDTLTKPSNPVPRAIDTPPLAPPTLCMDFGANDGPLAGQDGEHVASSKIRQRLLAETDNNVTLKVEPSRTDSEKTTVYARGELQLGILLEQMRREGYEMIVSPPKILTTERDGTTYEPYEEVTVDVDAAYSGTVIAALTGDRKGTLLEMNEVNGKCTLLFDVPSRGLLGFHNEIATQTKGSAVVNHLYSGDRPYQNLGLTPKGKLVSNDTGKATQHALVNLQQRGTLFVAPGDALYPGLVIGENAKLGDLEVNAVRQKEKTNMRTQSKDERSVLPPAQKRSVEELIGYMEEDEVIEVTPRHIRLRKLLLDNGARERAARVRTKQVRSNLN